MSTVGPIGHIKHSLDLVGLTDEAITIGYGEWEDV